MENIFKDAKIGDEVIIRKHPNNYIDVISHITPSGIITTKAHGIFNPNGDRRGAKPARRGFYFGGCSARIVTPEKIEEIKAKNRKDALVSKFKSCDWDVLSLSELEAISQIITKK